MVARQAAKAGQRAAQEAGPNWTEPPEAKEAEDPAQVVRDVFGDAIAWERSFDHLKDAEGNTVYVDRATGVMYDTLPKLAKDGRDA